MGGTIAITIKLRKDQHEVFKNILPTREVSFLIWTNWIAWMVNNPDLWVEPNKQYTSAENRYLTQHASLKEIIKIVKKDTKMGKGCGILQYPIPYEYGIICLDLENHTIFNSQGYSTPGNFNVGTYSTAFKEQSLMIKKLCDFSMLQMGVCPMYGYSITSVSEAIIQKPYSSKLAELKANGFAYSIWDEGKEIISINGGVVRPKQSGPKNAIILSPGAIKYLFSTPIDELNPLLNLNLLFHKSYPFKLTEYPEPTHGNGAIKRIKAINRFFETNKWESRVPIAKLNQNKFTNVEEDMAYRHEIEKLAKISDWAK